MLTVRFTKISPTHHEFEYIRPDGSGEKVKLESKTFLLHDFIHYAIESEAKLENSFYGLLAKGAKISDLSDGTEVSVQKFGDEIEITERVTGAINGVIKGEATPGTIYVRYEKYV
ncbi:hypothetical protein KW783_01780 [Candidatus Parcubacteria bacterium]|nr:hypothetical protein [Candidatus Parcubacteria bacterium]